MKRWHPALLAALLVLSGCGLQEDLSARAGGGAEVGSAAPAFTGQLLTGKTMSSRSLAGKVVVLDFWGSWCAPCQAEQPELNALAHQFQSLGVVFLGVDLRDDRASARAFVAGKAVPYDSIFDADQQITAAFDVSAPPTTVVIDSHGRIAGTFLATTSGIASLLNTLIGPQNHV